MKSEQLRFKFLESRRRIIFANQFCWNSIRAPFRHNILHCQNFWRPVEWPSIQRFCTFIPSAAFHLHHKTLFDAICFFNPKQRKRGVLSQLETWMSWRQPGTERRSFIFFPSHTLSFQHDIRCGRRLAVGYTCHAQGHDKRHTLNWITYLICLYKWFLFQLWCFFMGQQVESFNIFHKMQSWWPRSKTPPPSSANSVSWIIVHLVYVAKRRSPLTQSATLMDHFAWFQASAAKYIRSALSWDITQRIVVIPYRRFGTTYRSHLQGSINWRFGFLTLEDGTDRSYRTVGKELPLHAS